MRHKPPYFPFYVHDFSADGKVEAMQTEQVGAYILLLCKAWCEDPPGSIPNDDTVLARWARLTPERWTVLKPGVLATFTLGTDDRWHQKRMREEFAKFVQTAKKKSDGGKKGAQNRWSHGSANGLPNGIANGKNMASGSGSEDGSQGNGGAGGKGIRDSPDDPPTGDAASWLTREWVLRFRGTANSERDHEKLTGFFGDLLTRGIPAAAIEARIRDPARRKTEATWEFEKFWEVPNGSKQRGGVGSPVRISTPQRSIDAGKAKTLRLRTDEPDGEPQADRDAASRANDQRDCHAVAQGIPVIGFG